MKELTLQNINNIDENFYLVEFETKNDLDYFIFLEKEKDRIYKELEYLNYNFEDVYCRIFEVDKNILLKDFKKLENEEDFDFYENLETYKLIDSLNFIKELKEFEKIGDCLKYDEIHEIESEFDIDFKECIFEDVYKFESFKSLLNETFFKAKKWDDNYPQKADILKIINKYQNLIKDLKQGN